jgi:hypothetical protein
VRPGGAGGRAALLDPHLVYSLLNTREGGLVDAKHSLTPRVPSTVPCVSYAVPWDVCCGWLLWL